MPSGREVWLKWFYVASLSQTMLSEVFQIPLCGSDGMDLKKVSRLAMVRGRSRRRSAMALVRDGRHTDATMSLHVINH